MTSLTSITYTKNNKQEIVFTNEWNDPKNWYYLQLKDGDVTPLHLIISSKTDMSIVCPYIPGSKEIFTDIWSERSIELITLDDGIIAVNYLVKTYLASSNNANCIVVLTKEYVKKLENLHITYQLYKAKFHPKPIPSLLYTEEDDNDKTNKYFFDHFKKIIIIVKELNTENIAEINNIAKNMSEKYGVEYIHLIAIHCLVDSQLLDDNQDSNQYIDKFTTTTSTGLLEPKKSDRLEIIDAIEFFKHIG